MRSVWLALGVVLIGAGQASASIVRAMSVEELAQRADAVVLGTVTAQEAHWTRDHRQIFTSVRVHLEARWLDRVATADTITLLRPGGELDQLEQEIAGEPRFEVGERVVLFVRRQGHVYRVLGISQGVFRATGATASQELSGLALARPGPTGHLSIDEQGEGGGRSMTLSELKTRVLAAAPARP